MWHAGKYLVRAKSSVTECVSDWLIEIVFTTLRGEMPSFGQKNILIFTYQNRILYNKTNSTHNTMLTQTTKTEQKKKTLKYCTSYKHPV